MEIFDTNIEVLKFQIKHLSNDKLFNEYKDTFQALGVYKAKNEIENTQILEISKAYISEFMRRLRKYQYVGARSAILEFVKKIQKLLKEIRLAQQGDFTPYLVNTSVRLYSLCIRVIKSMRLDPKFIKKEFL